MPEDDPPFLIRPLRRSDLTAALAIQAESYPSFLQEDEAAFASRLDVAASYCLAATRDGKLFAYLLAHGWPSGSPPPIGAVLPRNPTNEVLYIHDLAVSACGRGSGIGRDLVARAFGLAARDGLQAAELIAVEGAADYWRSLGFVEAAPSESLAAEVAGYGASARWMTHEIRSAPTG
ncbi:GNAT family N-acetyltransferase [Sphingosinicella terrae]|uniref:GNAT family N-acetyltransferase n=1 Tax=Sphingosinicella terrae TaxID=2172047 RepID=UPI002548D73B|nr:GNAT family N-acetyltransferase [Sphingosinicella terrae]